MISSTCNKWIQSARQDFIVIGCANINNSFSNKRIINHCAYLSSFNPARYPDFNTVCINAKNAERGINSAKRVFDFICKMLGLTN